MKENENTPYLYNKTEISVCSISENYLLLSKETEKFAFFLYVFDFYEIDRDILLANAVSYEYACTWSIRA